MSKSKYYLMRDRRNSRTTVFILLGILVFVFVFFPFYGMNLRYHVAAVFSKIFDTIGIICLLAGGLAVSFSVLGIFTGRTINTRTFIIGIVLLWVGCWCTGAVLKLFGNTIGGSSSPENPGYH
ncbi:hypothetical protein ES705_06574 [subsurface metagenome]